MPDFTAYKHPVLAVRCPDCGRAEFVVPPTERPSGDALPSEPEGGGGSRVHRAARTGCQYYS